LPQGRSARKQKKSQKNLPAKRARSEADRLGFQYSNGSTMNDHRDKKSGNSAKDLRHERLKQALRENLKRRKSQAKGREDFTIPSSNSVDVAVEKTGKKHPGK
jgi:hypothetical protein